MSMGLREERSHSNYKEQRIVIETARNENRTDGLENEPLRNKIKYIVIEKAFIR